MSGEAGPRPTRRDLLAATSRLAILAAVSSTLPPAGRATSRLGAWSDGTDFSDGTGWIRDERG